MAEPPAIPFNRPHATGHEFGYIQEAFANRHLSGNGPFTRRCASWLEEQTGSHRAFLAPSCTAALEMAALLADLGPGDEVILPSFTFVSTASAIALRGAVPVFVDIRGDTLNLDEDAAAAAVTKRTKAIIAVHYAGVGCEMDAISGIAEADGLLVIEDAAQALMSTYKGRPLGSLGHLGTISFHETKNVTCGEGGALLVSDPSWVARAEVIQEKGTNRHEFFRGEADKYTWVDLGSSFLMSDVSAAFLWAQLERAQDLTARRLEVWERYHRCFAELEDRERLRRPIVPDTCRHNGHMYYLLLPDRARRDSLIDALAEEGIMALFHYVPLHSSPAGRRYGRTAGTLRRTEEASANLVRLPLWVGMTEAEVERVVGVVTRALV